MPHFISTVVIVNLMNLIFSPISGIYGNMFRLFGGAGFPTDLRGLPETFAHMYVWSGVWQILGWSTIIYTAALAGVSQELHEAAMIDGASRWERVLHVDLPSIMPTVCIMLIMRFGQIMSLGFEKTFLMQSELNKGVSEVISTYVYNKGMMGSMKEYSFGAAVGMFNSLINCAMLLLVNKITDWLSSGENSLF
jgi:putative aldouronate transport system permease protein